MNSYFGWKHIVPIGTKWQQEIQSKLQHKDRTQLSWFAFCGWSTFSEICFHTKTIIICSVAQIVNVQPHGVWQWAFDVNHSDIERLQLHCSNVCPKPLDYSFPDNSGVEAWCDNLLWSSHNEGRNWRCKLRCSEFECSIKCCCIPLRIHYDTWNQRICLPLLNVLSCSKWECLHFNEDIMAPLKSESRGQLQLGNLNE